MSDGERATSRLFVYGVDVGQELDHSALAIDERMGDAPSRHVLRHLERMPLKTPYARIVEYVTDLVLDTAVEKQRRWIVVDATGCGRPVVEMFHRTLKDRCRERPGLVTLVAVTITAADTVTTGKGFPWLWLHVPKRDVVTALQVLLEGKRLEAAADAPDVKAWRTEMTAYRRKLTKRALDTYEGAKEHDDLVMASGLACWYAEHRLPRSVVELGERPPRLRPKVALKV